MSVHRSCGYYGCNITNVTPRGTMDALTEAEITLGLTLKEKQKEAILDILEGKDVFCALPTGYGKSIIYGILPTAFVILLGEVTN